MFKDQSCRIPSENGTWSNPAASGLETVRERGKQHVTSQTLQVTKLKFNSVDDGSYYKVLYKTSLTAVKKRQSLIKAIYTCIECKMDST